jgi:uncharacterized protein (TIGR02996 family)
MTSQDVAFIEAIREQPGDDSVRLIYADWLMDRDDPDDVARGEFIRLQIDRDAGRRDDETPEAELTARHGAAWLRPFRTFLGPHVPWWTRYPEQHWFRQFERGFLETFELPAQVFVDHAGAIARLTPLRKLTITHFGNASEALFKSPWLASVEGLWLLDHSARFDAPLLRWLADAPHLDRLENLVLSNNPLDEDAAAALARAPWLEQLTGLDLSGCRLLGPAFQRLGRASLPRLSWLRLSNNLFDLDVMLLLRRTTSLVDLEVAECNLSSFDLGVLDHTTPATLRRLSLARNALDIPRIQVLASMPLLGQLDSLDLFDCELTDEAIALLARSGKLQNLRELSLVYNHLTDAGVNALLDADLANLRVLELKENPTTRTEAEIRSRLPNLERLTLPKRAAT